MPSINNLPTLTIYRGFAPGPNHVWSPFVNKLETRLRLSKVNNYKVKQGGKHSSPKSKLPYLGIVTSSTSADSGTRDEEIISDTDLISKRLVRDGIISDLNTLAGLTPAERAQDLAIRTLLEERLYFFLARERWVDNYATMRDGVLFAIPWPLRWLVGLLAQRAVTQALYGQGAGRFTDEEASGISTECWEALVALLEESKRKVDADGKGPDEPFWVLGKGKPTEADTTVYGTVVAALVCDA